VKTAFLFPGQGAHQVSMISALERLPTGKGYLKSINEIAAVDLVREVREGGQPYLAKNEIASLVTVAFSLAVWRALEDSGVDAMACAGYSVGQWTAMCAAGMLTTEDTLRLIHVRAQCMNAAVDLNDGMMLAVVGLPAATVEDVCRKVATAGRIAAISNYNALGQVTIAGDRRSIEAARSELAALSPRQLTPVDVSGAWHCALMTPAADAFTAYLDEAELKSPRMPVADNVSGDLLPDDRKALVQALTRHLDRPVRWEQCVRRLIALGIERFVEVGFGNVLTKFGFFIDRSREFVTYDRLLRGA
jgi:[acyl-carrier-protein] S-malonyltransferase